MAAKGQAEMQELSNEAARESAQLAYQTDKNILIRRRQEEGEAFAQANFDRQRRAMELQAQANVSAGEAGVSGISVDRITRDIDRQSGEVGQRAKKSYENRLAAVDDQQTRAINTMMGRMANLPPVLQPNLLATALTSFSPMITDEAVAKSDAAIFKGYNSIFGTNYGA
jgi:membrane-anchored protein YejM (alkaline phosphatase superfamily)